MKPKARRILEIVAHRMGMTAAEIVDTDKRCGDPILGDKIEKQLNKLMDAGLIRNESSRYVCTSPGRTALKREHSTGIYFECAWGIKHSTRPAVCVAILSNGDRFLRG